MNDGKLPDDLEERLKAIIKDDVFSEEPISMNLPERHSKQVQ